LRPSEIKSLLICTYLLRVKSKSPIVCDNRTMVPPLAHSDNDFGRRIADARESEGRTQAELADAIGLDRTAVAKIEAGTRKVSAIELVAIAASLNRPIDWFVFESPHSVVSRRRDPAVGGYSRALDRVLESVARDLALLTSLGTIWSGMPMNLRPPWALTEITRAS
jgi:transcriptional regulator with XRE-family HTH domain